MRFYTITGKLIALVAVVSVFLGLMNSSLYAQDESIPVIRVWWPDSLYNSQAQSTINGILAEFQQNNSTIDIRYFEHAIGKDTHRLELTRNVAPTALPDMMLMHREDIATAVGSGLLRPISGWVPQNVLEGLSPNLLALGQVNDTLYGLPYMLDVQYMIYSPRIFATAPEDFQQVLAESTPVLFPGKARLGKVVNDMLVSQYIAEGGAFVDSEGKPSLDADALETVLTFYADGLSNGIFDPSLLSYSSPSDYRQRLSGQDTALALVNFAFFSNSSDPAISNYAASSLPTATGTHIMLMDGWVWVLLTSDPARQEQAQRLLTFLMDTDKLVDTAEGVRLLPGQQRALRVLDDPFIDNIRNLLPNAIFIGNEANNAAGAALQIAFESVLNGSDPSEATATAINSLASP